MGNSIAFIFKLIFWDVLGDALYFPVWWYTRGFLRMLRNGIQRVKNKEASLGVLLWIRNIFVPMFGQYDAVGRIISFLMRIFQIIVRSLLLLLSVIKEFALLILWIVLPIFAANEVFYHLKFFFY